MSRRSFVIEIKVLKALIKYIVNFGCQKTGMGTLGRVCGDLGLRDARRGTWDGDARRQIQGHRTQGR